MSVRHVGTVWVWGTLMLAGCGQTSYYSVLGKDLLEVNASGETLSRAITDASFALAQSSSTQPNSRSYPSFGQSGRSWGAKNNPDVLRVMTKFTDKSDRAVRIETVSHRDSAVLVFIDYEAPGDPMVVLNEITKSLEKAGVCGRQRSTIQ